MKTLQYGPHHLLWRDSQPALAVVVLPLLCLNLLVFLPMHEFSVTTIQVFNALVPLALLIAATAGAAHLVLRQPILLFSPLPWLLAACALYHGWGPLIYQYGTRESVECVQGFYRIDDGTLLKTNQLNAACLLTVCLCFVLAACVFPLSWSGGNPVFHQRSRDQFIVVCLLIGVPIRYVLVPLHNSCRLEFYLPTQILNLHELFLIALMLMTWSFMRGERKWNVVLCALFGIDFFIRFFGSGKLDLFLLMLPVFLGAFLARPGLKTLVTGFLVAIVLWLATVAICQVIRQATFAGGASTLSDRIGLAFSALEGDGDHADTDSIQGWWTRLCYAPVQGFCLRQFDSGQPGQTINLWYWAFLPRLLFPEKPEMTTGRMFNILVTGNPDSKSAPGLFAEAYWNGGWPLALATSAFTGLLILVLTHFAFRAVLSADYRWLPLVLTGIIMALRVDDWAVPTYLGSWPIGIASCLVLRMIFPGSMLRRARGKRGMPTTDLLERETGQVARGPARRKIA